MKNKSTEIWVWKCRSHAMQGSDFIVGWSWTEKEARAYAGNSLLSLKMVTLTEGQGLIPKAANDNEVQYAS